MPEVTISALVYKSVKWLDFLIDGLGSAHNDTDYELQVIANDPVDPLIMQHPYLTGVFRSQNPATWYIPRVYAAWNESVRQCRTNRVVLINSDMAVSDGWLDALMRESDKDPLTVPCSLLVESGRIPSAMPEYVKDFGLHPDTFKRDAWKAHAASIKSEGVEPGRLFMPCLFWKDAFLAAGGYPLGNPNGVSGDRVLFDRLAEQGYKHLTVKDSVVYHVQEGEMRGT